MSTLMNRARFVPRTLAILVIALGSSSGVHGQDPGSSGEGAIQWRRDRRNPHMVRGQVVVPRAPADVWSRLRDVERWPRIFSDIRALRVVRRGGARWVVNLDTRAMEDCGPHDYRIRFDSARQLVDLEIDATGAEVVGRITVSPTRGGAASTVTYSLYVRATGIVGWFVSTDDLRRIQEQMVVRYLRDLAGAFAGPSS